MSVMIYDHLAIYLQAHDRYLLKYPYLRDDFESWSNKHYVALADILQLSQSFVKRLFGYPGHSPPENFNKNTKKRLLAYFDVSEWEQLETRALSRATAHQADQKLKQLYQFKAELKLIQDKIKNIYDQL